MVIWHLGNTTVRSPFRLRDGLVALSKSNLQGSLRGGKEAELAFCKLLSDEGIVSLAGDATYSIGRKWRSALEQLGFLYPKLPSNLNNFQEELGEVDFITPNGKRLISADTVAGWQECFLRSLASYSIPSAIKPNYDCQRFSPLRHVLAILSGLENKTEDGRLNFIEMAVIVQLSTLDDGADNIVEQIIEFRRRRELSVSKRQYDNDALDTVAQKFGMVSSTFKDYADTNFRYIKATGLVKSKGKGIALVQEKKVLIERLIQDDVVSDDDRKYFKSLCEGAKLPTDDLDGANAVMSDLVGQLRARGEDIDLSSCSLDTPADIAIVRHKAEDRLSELNEIEYAAEQVNKIDEISGYINLLVHRRFNATLDCGEEISIPKGEAPAYFEWIIWRAFLAINSLVNNPWDARQFKIDQDYLPVNTAPGGRPDMIFEFDDSVLVVEVTLTTSSRQEAAEGEPVRRHVATYAEKYASSGKSVYGLFLAVIIDTNTANTFRLGEWYTTNDEKLDLEIVPIPLDGFNNILKGHANEPAEILPKLFNLMKNCRAHVGIEAPQWKEKINELTSGVSSA